MKAMLGEEALLAELLDELQGRTAIKKLAEGLGRIMSEGSEDEITQESWERNPGW